MSILSVPLSLRGTGVRGVLRCAAESCLNFVLLVPVGRVGRCWIGWLKNSCATIFPAPPRVPESVRLLRDSREIYDNCDLRLLPGVCSFSVTRGIWIRTVIRNGEISLDYYTPQQVERSWFSMEQLTVGFIESCVYFVLRLEERLTTT